MPIQRPVRTQAPIPSPTDLVADGIEGTIPGVQTLELAGVFALVGITVFLMRAHLANLNDAPLPLRLAVGFGVGALIGLFMLVRGTDVIPDGQSGGESITRRIPAAIRGHVPRFA